MKTLFCFCISFISFKILYSRFPGPNDQKMYAKYMKNRIKRNVIIYKERVCKVKKWDFKNWITYELLSQM